MATRKNSTNDKPKESHIEFLTSMAGTFVTLLFIITFVIQEAAWGSIMTIVFAAG